jgi:hypothetical protein
MKTMTALLVGLTTTLALSTAAVAEPWKDRTPLSFDRSPDATANIQSNPNTPSIAMNAPTTGGFNQRGPDWVASVQSNLNTPRIAVNIPTTGGFNQRGPDWAATSPVGSQTPRGTVASSS